MRRQIRDHRIERFWRSAIWEQEGEDLPPVVIEIRVPIQVESLNKYKPNFRVHTTPGGMGAHIARVQKAKRVWADKIRAALGPVRWEQPTTRARLTITTYRDSKRPYDDENFRGGCKMPIDVLNRQLNLIREDSPHWICHGDHVERLVPGHPELVHTHFIIEYGVPDYGKEDIAPPFEPGCLANCE